jgi:CRP-like cAMP-binding protein
MSKRLDRWVSENIRDEIEQRFYAKVTEQADFNRLARDPDFMAAPNQHVGLFADHGIVHARDVANHVLDVLANCHGVLIPHRNPHRFALMEGYGVLLAYFHDIGMIDFSRFGRIMHPEYAAQAVFDPELDDLIDSIWQENSGGLAWHLRTLAEDGLMTQEPIMVLREMLSLSLCHSKSKIPVAMLNDPALLRHKLIEVISTDLHALYTEQQIHSGQPARKESNGQDVISRPNPKIGRFSHLFPDRAFCWLIDDHPAWQAVVEDIIDTCRALRAADALRQRGTVLETSGNYQIFIDQCRGSAVYALRLGEHQLYLLEMLDPISAGEANIASSELVTSGDLRISFHRGSFSDPGAREYAARSAAIIVDDIQKDVIRSFIRSTVSPGLKPASEMMILLEETEDDVSFPQMVQHELIKLDPNVADRVRVTPSLKHVHSQERERYLAAEPIPWGLQARHDLLAHMGQAGYPIERIDEERAFIDVRLVALEAGEILIEARTPSSFVYIPLNSGLKIIPLGGYHSISVQPWMLLGMTGVVRGAERNATVVAERGLQVIVIPKTTYLTYWHHTLSLEEFRTTITQAVADSSSPPGSFSQLEKSTLLQTVPLFKTLNQQALMELASRVSEVHVTAGEMVIEKGSIGRNLFVVVEGSLHAHDDTLLLTLFGPGDVFGEMAAVTPEPRMANVTAVENSIILRLDQRDLNYLIDDNADIARGIIEVLASYVRSRTADIAKPRSQLDNKTTASLS